jgi:GntR family negative regulator for fad regulon and positive regulator of fabA
MKLNPGQLLRPAQYAEKFLVTAILDGTYSTGASLPNERRLAEQMGITRPTLRETLRRLAGEGWITIHHGKPTVVNDYWQEGGLSLLSTLARYADYLPNGFITHLLEVRLTMLPPVARRAAIFNPKIIMAYLEKARDLAETARNYADYDWNLQMLMARNSHNPVFSLILNDFSSIFTSMALTYFGDQMARQASGAYYRELTRVLDSSPGAVEQVVERAMQESISIWQDLRSRSGESGMGMATKNRQQN